MTWSTFIVWIGVAYGVYYALVLLIDVLKGVKPGGVSEEEAIDVSGLYDQAGTPAEVIMDDEEPESVADTEEEEERFVVEMVSKKKVTPRIFDSAGPGLVAVHSVGMSLTDLIANQKKQAVQATANIHF